MLTYMLDTNICIYVMKTYPPPSERSSTRWPSSDAYRASRLGNCTMARRSAPTAPLASARR
jgi:hypothetical protein